MQPLDGLVVLDFSTLLPGPLATLLLAEAGAEVIKVERPGVGDETRHYPGDIDGESVVFALLNRGKGSLALDLKSEAGLAALEPQLARADILVEQFRPGVMDRLGLGYATLSKRFPQLIYCSITGYGQTGARANVAGHDLNYIAEAGLLALSSGSASAPTVPPALIADIAGGSYPAVVNILLALEARRRTGQGQHLDVAMTDNLFPLMWWALGQKAASGHTPGNADHVLSGGTARYRLYPTSDAQIVAAAPIEDRFWVSFCDAIDLPEVLRAENDPHETCDAVARIIASKPGAAWSEIFAKADCCANVVRSLDAALADPHVAARGLFDARLPIGGGEISALPVPLAPSFRRLDPVGAPPLGSLDPDL